MRPSLFVLGALMVVVGAVWLGQGLGLIKGSFMTGVPLWSWVGAALLVAGAALLFLAGRRRLPGS